MKTLTPNELVTVAGGTTTANAQLTQQLTALQSSIKDVASASANKQNDPMTMMMMMMAMRPQAPAVVAPAAPAAPQVINVSSRGRW